MKVILTSAVAIAAIAVAANFGLDRAGFSAQDQQSGSSVRLD
ncbi:hypothetical protein ACS3QZ_18645 [Shimia sp. W99]